MSSYCLIFYFPTAIYRYILMENFLLCLSMNIEMKSFIGKVFRHIPTKKFCRCFYFICYFFSSEHSLRTILIFISQLNQFNFVFSVKIHFKLFVSSFIHTRYYCGLNSCVDVLIAFMSLNPFIFSYACALYHVRSINGSIHDVKPKLFMSLMLCCVFIYRLSFMMIFLYYYYYFD